MCFKKFTPLTAPTSPEPVTGSHDEHPHGVKEEKSVSASLPLSSVWMMDDSTHTQCLPSSHHSALSCRRKIFMGLLST